MKSIFLASDGKTAGCATFLKICQKGKNLLRGRKRYSMLRNTRWNKFRWFYPERELWVHPSPLLRAHFQVRLQTEIPNFRHRLNSYNKALHQHDPYKAWVKRPSYPKAFKSDPKSPDLGKIRPVPGWRHRHQLPLGPATLLDGGPKNVTVASAGRRVPCVGFSIRSREKGKSGKVVWNLHLVGAHGRVSGRELRNQTFLRLARRREKWKIVPCRGDRIPLTLGWVRCESPRQQDEQHWVYWTKSGLFILFCHVQRVQKYGLSRGKRFLSESWRLDDQIQHGKPERAE